MELTPDRGPDILDNCPLVADQPELSVPFKLGVKACAAKTAGIKGREARLPKLVALPTRPRPFPRWASHCWYPY